MTKYRIKNPDIEKAVRGLFKTVEDFEFRFNNVCSVQLQAAVDKVCINVNADDCVTGESARIDVNVKDIEKVREYDPNDWNPCHMVKPPHFGHYLVTQVGGQVRSAEYVQTLDGDPGSHYFDTHWDVPGVVAFRELPKAYEGEK